MEECNKLAKRGSANQELATELKGGISSVRLVGKVRVASDTFEDPKCKEGKTWNSIRNTFGVEVSDGNVHYVTLQGGYKTDKPLIYTFNEDLETIQVKWQDRFKDDILDTIPSSQKIVVSIEKDEDGKRIRKEFLHIIDVNEYLAEHLENGAEVVVMADVERQPGKEDRVYTSYNLKMIALNEEYTMKSGEVREPAKHEALLRQTFLLNEYSLDKKWKKQLEDEGETLVSAFVPQYVSSILVGDSYVKVKDKVSTSTLPIPVSFKIKLDTKASDDAKASRINLYKKWFSIGKEKVREFYMMMELNEGYTESTGDVEITAEMQELIDAGIMQKEEIESEVTVRGERVSEIIFIKPGFVKDPDNPSQKVIAIRDDKYAEQALVMPNFNTEYEDEIEEDEDDLGFGEDEFNNEEETVEETVEEDEEEDDPLAGMFDDDSIFD